MYLTGSPEITFFQGVLPPLLTLRMESNTDVQRVGLTLAAVLPA
jgi:hypothetical protein